jgi:uncharacterized phage protein (TIGR01671 family)
MNKREIKFRGQEVGEWVYGYYVHNKYGHLIYDKDYIFHNVSLETVGQYTGLKDKNKKEIYEGDIVKEKGDINWRRGYPLMVLYSEKEQGFRVHAYIKNEWVEVRKIGNNEEIIGNKFENPELLNE